MGKRIFGFNRNVFFLGLVSFFNDFSAEMVQSVMPVFLTVTLGASAALVGMLEGVADALASTLKVFSGWFSDRIGRRKLPAVLGYTLSVGVRPFLALATTFSQVFSLRIIDRVGKGMRDAPRDALISESIEPSEFGKSFGLHRALDTLGATVGPLAAFFLLPLLGQSYQKLFLVAFVIGLGAIASFAFVDDKRVSAPRVGGDTRAPTVKSESRLNVGTVGAPANPPANPRAQEGARLDAHLLKRNRAFIRMVCSVFIFGLGALPIVLLLLKAKEVGLPGGSLPLVYFIYSLSFVLGSVPLGRLADKIGEGKVIAGGFAVAVLAYLGLAGTHDLVLTILLFALLGVYAAATDGVERSFAAKHLSSDVLAAGQGFLNMAVGFSSLVAGVVGGFLWTRFGSAVALDYAGAASLVGLALFMYTDRTILGFFTNHD